MIDASHDGFCFAQIHSAVTISCLRRQCILLNYAAVSRALEARFTRSNQYFLKTCGHLYSLSGGLYNIEFLQAYESVHHRIDHNNDTGITDYIIANGYKNVQSNLKRLAGLTEKKFIDLQQFVDDLKDAMDLRIEIVESFFDPEEIKSSNFQQRPWVPGDMGEGTLTQLPKILTKLARHRAFVVVEAWVPHVEMCLDWRMKALSEAMNKRKYCVSREEVQFIYAQEQIVMRFVHGDVAKRYNLRYVNNLRSVNEMTDNRSKKFTTIRESIQSLNSVTFFSVKSK